MKKINKSLLFVLSVLTLASCGGTTGNNNSTANNSSEIQTSETSIDTGSKEIGAVAKNANVTMDKTVPAIALSDLFDITATEYEVSSNNAYVMASSTSSKTVLNLYHAGVAVITVTTAKGSASCKVTIFEAEANLSTVKQVFASIKKGYYLEGIDYTYGGVASYQKVITPKYTYDLLADNGYGIFKDGNVYKFKGTVDTNTFVATGSSIGSGSTWAAGLFQDFDVTKSDVYFDNEDVILPRLSIGSVKVNPLATSLIKQIGFNEKVEYSYLRLSSFETMGFFCSFVTGLDKDGSENVMGRVQMSDFGIAGIDEVEAYLESAEAPEAGSQDNLKLKNKMLQYKNSKSYRVYGADVTDSDREVFYNLYTPNQYYEYFMDEGFGYINAKGAVYKYTKNSMGFAELAATPYGSYKDYKEFTETLYTVDDSLFDTCRADPSDDTYYTYTKSSDDGVLAKFLLHSLGYDSNGGENFYNDFDAAYFLVDGDIVYCDIDLKTMGQIKFQFDQLNSASLPTYVEETEFSVYAKTYTGNMSIKIDGEYVNYTATMVLNADYTGTFAYDTYTYDIAWNPQYDASNKSKINLNLSITSQTTKGESFTDGYIYTWNNGKATVNFSYDSSTTATCMITFSPKAN